MLTEMLAATRYTPYECCLSLMIVAANYAPADGKRVCLAFFADALDGAEYLRKMEGEA